eukprot:s118_g23.t1
MLALCRICSISAALLTTHALRDDLLPAQKIQAESDEDGLSYFGQSYVARRSFTPKSFLLEGLSCEKGDAIRVTHDPRNGPSAVLGSNQKLAYGQNERTGLRGWFPLSEAELASSSLLQRSDSVEDSGACQDTYFSDWGSSGMKVHKVHLGGGGDFLFQAVSVKLSLTAKSNATKLGPELNKLAQELEKPGRRWVAKNAWEILSTAGHRLEVENAERLFAEVRRLGDVPVSRGGLQGLLYKCSKQHNETEGCRTLPGSLEAVYEMGAYLMSMDEASQKYQKMKKGPMGFVSAGGASLQIGITSPWASHAEQLRNCIAGLDNEVKVDDGDFEARDELPGDVTSLGDIKESPPGSRRAGPSLAKVAHFPGGQPVALFSFLAVGTNPPACIEGGCAHEVGGVNEMRLQFENHLIQQGFDSNPCVESAADFPLATKGAAFTRNLIGGASGSEEDLEKCQSAVTQFLDSDLTLQRWKTGSGCYELAASVSHWGLLTSFARVRAERSDIKWCSSGGPFKNRKVNCGAVLTQTLLDSILQQLGVEDAQPESNTAVGWEASLYALRGLQSGVCFKQSHDAWGFLLEGLQTRLRHGARGPALEAVRRDLGSLDEAATETMQHLLQVARDAPTEVATLPEDAEGHLDRFFWLTSTERRQVAELGQRASKDAENLRELLKETHVLAQTVALEEHKEREELLWQRLGVEQEEEVKKEVRYDEWGDPI